MLNPCLLWASEGIFATLVAGEGLPLDAAPAQSLAILLEQNDKASCIKRDRPLLPDRRSEHEVGKFMEC